MRYEQAYEDHKYLWSIGAAVDMTGRYVDQEDLAKLLKAPTKSTALACLRSQIEYWFQVGPDRGDSYGADPMEYVRTDPKVAEIAERHGII